MKELSFMKYLIPLSPNWIDKQENLLWCYLRLFLIPLYLDVFPI